MTTSPDQDPSSFYALTNDEVLNSVETALERNEIGRRATGSIFALNSLENRVYEIEFEDGYKVVTKFYRPHRWTPAQILEEHFFLSQLLSAEIPVVAPLSLQKNLVHNTISHPLPDHLRSMKTLGLSRNNIAFAVFPLVKGRLLDELSETHLQTLGRYVGRLHRIGAKYLNSLRPRLDINTFGWDSLDFLATTNFFETEAVFEQYESAVGRLLDLIEPLFDRVPFILTHGDCHLGNTLWQGEAPFFLDFDDLCLAPAVQDIWMIVRGRDKNAIHDREILLKSYEQMNEFNDSQLALIEPLRALRIIHYSAWIAKRWDDPSFPKAFPDFASTRYWHEEISELYKIEEAILAGSD